MQTNNNRASTGHTAAGDNDQVQKRVVLLWEVMAQKLAWLGSADLACLCDKMLCPGAKFSSSRSSALNANQSGSINSSILGFPGLCATPPWGAGSSPCSQLALLTRKIQTGPPSSLTHPAAMRGFLQQPQVHLLCLLSRSCALALGPACPWNVTSSALWWAE